MILQVFTPAFPLNEFINHFIFYEGFEAAHNKDRFLPDGNTEIVIDLSNNKQFIYDNETLEELQSCQSGWVSGIRTRPITIPSGNGSRMLIVALKQGKAYPFYHMPLSELTDLVVDADLILGKSFHSLRDQLVNAASINQMFILLEKYLTKQAGEFLNASTTEKCIEFAVDNISRQPDAVGFQKLGQTIGYSKKHFIDLFKKQVGVVPKQYLKIMRFQKAILEIESRDSVQWSSVALEGGFYDQAHFINDFKAFSGFTPNEYIKKKSETLNYVPVG